MHEHCDSFGRFSTTPTSVVLDRKHKRVDKDRVCLTPGLWDDLAELVLG